MAFSFCLCTGQVRSGQVRSGQVRPGQVRSGQVRSGSGQVCGFDSRSKVLPLKNYSVGLPEVQMLSSSP